jgi:hypothetical protein
LLPRQYRSPEYDRGAWEALSGVPPSALDIWMMGELESSLPLSTFSLLFPFVSYLFVAFAVSPDVLCLLNSAGCLIYECFQGPLSRPDDLMRSNDRVPAPLRALFPQMFALTPKGSTSPPPFSCLLYVCCSLFHGRWRVGVWANLPSQTGLTPPACWLYLSLVPTPSCKCCCRWRCCSA